MDWQQRAPEINYRCRPQRDYVAEAVERVKAKIDAVFQDAHTARIKAKLAEPTTPGTEG